MRPGSRGFTASGAPPGSASGLRPGSGRKPPGTGANRLRTAASGPGTQAAQGIALTASVNIHDRPVTGQGVMGMRTQGFKGRLVEDSALYIGLLRKRIADVQKETTRLNTAIDSNSKDSNQLAQLEKKHEMLLKDKEALEGQLADYNLALDKTRTHTDPGDVKDSAVHLAEKNRQTRQELDRILIAKKQKESDTLKVEEQIDSIYRDIQNRINDLDPGKLRAYNDLISKQRELQDRLLYSENRMNEILLRISQYETDDKSNSYRREYSTLEKKLQTLRRDLDSLQEELSIANMDPKEAHTKFVARVNELKQNTKVNEEKAATLREETTRMKRHLEELESSGADEDAGDAAKYELLVKRDQDMTAFMDKFDETRLAVLEEQRAVQDTIVALMEHMGREMEQSAQLPSQDALSEMEQAKNFKEKNLATAQRTMESLQIEHRKRQRELETLKSSEPTFTTELQTLKERMKRMRAEMKDFQDLDGLRKSFDATQLKLQAMKHAYIKRRDSMRQQVQSLSMEHELLKKNLNNSDIVKEIDETEKRLKHNERSIFEMREFVEIKSRETDFELVKGNCLRLMGTLNGALVKKMTGSSGAAATAAGPRNAQAKW